MVAGVMRMMGFDERKLGIMALNMIMYVGELFANTLLGLEDDIENEIPQYRSFAPNGGIFPILKVAIERSSERASKIKESLLDAELTSKMISTLKEKTGNTTSCVQLLLCKMTPVVRSVQEATGDTVDSMYGRSLYHSRYIYEVCNA